MSAAQRPQPLRAFRDGAWCNEQRATICEVAIAIVVDGGAEAVMMVTPINLRDFALGFALTEGLVEAAAQIREIEIVEAPLGIEARLWLSDPKRVAHAARRRRRAGPAGCGLCGVESLSEAMRPIPRVESELRLRATDILAAMHTLPARQTLNRSTYAAHAAALYTPGQGLSHVREDIGRHNALDKLAGALAREQLSASESAILMTSRLSVELVQKAAILGAPVLAAISAPSTLAIDAADRAGITLIGVVRNDGLEVYTHADRIE